MMERRKKKIRAMMKIWLIEKLCLSKGLYTWVIPEFHTRATSVTGELCFRERESGFPSVDEGNSPAAAVTTEAEPPLLMLGVPRAQPGPASSNPGDQQGWEVLLPGAEIPDTRSPGVGQRGRGERLVHEKVKTAHFSLYFIRAGVANEKFWLR